MLKKSWKQMNLRGAGLQAVNASLTRQMRHRRTAYLLLLLAPLGLHRFYLKELWGGVAYLLLAVLLILGLVTANIPFALMAGVAIVVFLVFDAFWIDRRVNDYNKSLRMRIFLQPGKNTGEEKPTETKKRMPSFADQEAMLREMTRKKDADNP
ncbi:NINE protein [Ectothiorhodosinus mongolicus]|nr:NINE protein [Ectothiorhodosinus mongolicus]